MMEKLRKYIGLIEEHPKLFENKEEGTLKIITDPERIKREESKLKREFRGTEFQESFGEIGVLVDDPYFLVLRDLVEFPNGRLGGYLRFINKASLEGAQAVAILPVYKGKIIVLRNFRHATRNWEFEIPRGFGEKGISPEDNAKKELFEETGSVPNKLIKLGTLHVDTAVRSSPVFLFYADVNEINSSIEEKEEVISGKIFLDQMEFEDMIKQGDIKDAFTVSAYSMAKIWGLL